MHESKLYPDRQKRVLVDIDETICFYEGKRVYENAIPSKELGQTPQSLSFVIMLRSEDA